MQFISAQCGCFPFTFETGASVIGHGPDVNFMSPVRMMFTDVQPEVFVLILAGALNTDSTLVVFPPVAKEELRVGNAKCGRTRHWLKNPCWI